MEKEATITDDKLNATREQYASFFESFVWQDIKSNIIGAAIQQALAELSNPNISDLNTINYARGRLEAFRNLENLEQIIQDAFDHEEEERRLTDVEEYEDAQ